MTSNELISNALRSWRWRVVSAHVASIILGLMTALLGVIVGPSLLSLFASTSDFIKLSDLLGSTFASALAPFVSITDISRADFFRLMPIAIIVVVSIKAVALFYQWYTWELIGERMAWGWRNDVVRRFVDLDPVKREHLGLQAFEEQLGSHVTQDIRNVREFIVHYYGGLPREGLQVLFSGVVLFLLSPKLFAIFILCIAPVGALISRLGRRIRRRASRALENNSSITEWIQQRLLGLETIKHYRTEAHEVQSLHGASESLFNRLMAAAKLKSRTSPIIELFGVCAMSVALAIAIGDVAKGALPGAVVVSFFGTLSLFAQSAAKLGRYFNSNHEGRAAAERIVHLSDALDAAQVDHGDKSTNIGFEAATYNGLKINDLTVIYDAKKDPVVRHFSYDFLGGKIYCLIGKSGAGKSTIFNCILGLNYRASGTIRGYSRQDLGSKSVKIASIPQSMPIIATSLARNISYPHEVVDEAKVLDSLSRAHFSLDPERLPQGIHTLIGPNGLQLSGGQLQRLYLARLVYHQAPVVLVDEGTSALDPNTESDILNMLRALAREGACVVMIAHRKRVAEICDELLVITDGKLAKTGTPSEILATPESQAIFGI